MNRIRNITLKSGLFFVSFGVGAMISGYLLIFLLISLGNSVDVIIGWFMMIATVSMLAWSYLFRDTFHLFNPRHWLFRRFIQFLLFQLILSFLYSFGLSFSVYSAYWRIIYGQFKWWPILDPHLHGFIQLVVVLLSMVAITVAARIIFQGLSRVHLNFSKVLLLFLAIILLMVQITITLFLGYTLLSCNSSISCKDRSFFSPNGLREIRWTYPVSGPFGAINLPDGSQERAEFISGGAIFITRIAYSPVWKSLYGYIVYADPGESPKEVIWSKDSSKAYIVSVDKEEFDRKRIDPERIVFGYDFRNDREIDPETDCSDYWEFPDLILSNETCPPEPENQR